MLIANPVTGDLDRPLQALDRSLDKLHTVNLVGEGQNAHLLFLPVNSPAEARRNAKGILGDFIALARAKKPDRFLKFAERWGRLGLCEHGESALHGGRN